MHLHFATKSPLGSEKKLLVMDVFMVIANVWSLSMTVGKEKACLTGAWERVVAHRNVEAAHSLPASATSVEVGMLSQTLATKDPLVPSLLCYLIAMSRWLKGNSLGLSPSSLLCTNVTRGL